MEDVWPEQKSRGPVHANLALQSIRSIRNHALKYGLSALQISALILTAITTLQKSNNKIFRSGKGVTVGVAIDKSLLLDGTSKHFCSIVRCLLPKLEMQEDSQNSEILSLRRSTAILRLISAASSFDSSARCCVLHFLTLLFQTDPGSDNFLLELPKKLQNGTPSNIKDAKIIPMKKDKDARENAFDLLSIIFNVTFPWMLKFETSLDAVRLLLTLITFARDAKFTQSMLSPPRGEKVRAFFQLCCKIEADLEQTEKGKKNKKAKANCERYFLLHQIRRAVVVIPTVLELFNYYSQSSLDKSQLSISTKAAKIQQLLDFPDASWKSAFWRQTKFCVNSFGIGTQLEKLIQLETADGIEQFLENIKKKTDPLRVIEWDRFFNKCTCSEIMQNVKLRHSLLLLTKSLAREDIVFLNVFRKFLPFALHEEFNLMKQAVYANGRTNVGQSLNGPSTKISKSTTPGKCNNTPETNTARAAIQPIFSQIQISLLRATADFAIHADGIPAEIEHFIIYTVLPSWDGDHAFSQSRVLFCEVLPYLRPRSFADLLHSGVLSCVRRLFLLGDVKLQWFIFSGFLAPLLQRWKRVDWLASEKVKAKTLHDLIQWSDDCLVKGFLVSGNVSHELLCLSSSDFFNSILKLSDTTAVLYATTGLSLITQRLLVGSSAVHLEKACALLVELNNSIDKIREQSGNTVLSSTSLQSELEGVFKLFTCLVWDVCCALWVCSNPQQTNDEKERKQEKKPKNNDDDDDDGNSILFADIQSKTNILLGQAKTDVAHGLSVTHSAVFPGFVSAFILTYTASNDSHRLTPDLIQRDLKVEYLDYLKNQGLCGVHLFLSTFVRSLSKNHEP